MTILFKEYNTFQNVQTILDTIPVDSKGKFAKKFDYNPGIYQVDFVGIEKVNIAVERGQKVDIILTLPSSNNPTTQVEVNGSADAELVFEYDQKQKVAYDKWLHPVRRDIRLAKEAGKTGLIPELTKKEQENLIAYQNELAEFAKNNFGNSIALFYAAIRLNPSLHLDFMQHIADIFNKSRPDLILTKKYNTRIARFKQTAIGSIAPDIEFETQDGEKVKLSDFKGRYVLLDFWASWCNPCRFENINYAALYEKYNANGFEIFSISIDTNEKMWQLASKKDKITWMNVSDLKGWAGKAAHTYNVSALPANFFLDQTGKIIAKNIRGKELINELAQVFQR